MVDLIFIILGAVSASTGAHKLAHPSSPSVTILIAQADFQSAQEANP